MDFVVCKYLCNKYIFTVLNIRETIIIIFLIHSYLIFVLFIQSPIVVWKMKAPEKKPLVRPERPEEVRAKVRKGSQKKVQNPIHALSEFQSPTESV